jgi:acyl carrier protein
MSQLDYVARRQDLSLRIKRMIVERLELPTEPEWITDDQPIFGRGLELDSVDALELVVGAEFEFDVAISDDRVDAIGSVNRIVDFIEENAPGGS